MLVHVHVLKQILYVWLWDKTAHGFLSKLFPVVACKDARHSITDTSCTEVTFILIPCGQFHGKRNRKIVESNDEKPIILRVPCILLPEEDRQIYQKWGNDFFFFYNIYIEKMREWLIHASNHNLFLVLWLCVVHGTFWVQTIGLCMIGFAWNH